MKQTKIVEISPESQGKQLKAIRIEIGIRPSKVAKMTDMSYQRISDIENRRNGMTLSVAQAYCKAMGARLCVVYEVDDTQRGSEAKETQRGSEAKKPAKAGRPPRAKK